MSHSNPNPKRDLPASLYPNAGDNPRLLALAELADLITDWIIEAGRWPRTERERMSRQIEQMWEIRDQLATGHIEPLYARMWTEAGWAVLESKQRERSMSNHPAGRIRKL